MTSAALRKKLLWLILSNCSNIMNMTSKLKLVYQLRRHLKRCLSPVVILSFHHAFGIQALTEIVATNSLHPLTVLHISVRKAWRLALQSVWLDQPC